RSGDEHIEKRLAGRGLVVDVVVVVLVVVLVVRVFVFVVVVGVPLIVVRLVVPLRGLLVVIGRITDDRVIAHGASCARRGWRRGGTADYRLVWRVGPIAITHSTRPSPPPRLSPHAQ